VSIASAFAVRGFTHVALISRDAQRLSQDEDSVLSAIQERGYTCQVKTWSCDLTDFQALRKVLGEVEAFGSLECVLFNAARVGGKPPLEEGMEEMERDFRVSYSFLLVGNLSLSFSPFYFFFFLAFLFPFVRGKECTFVVTGVEQEENDDNSRNSTIHSIGLKKLSKFLP
jgi:NAD(P)-dependent dehydrogenase (short-subunit alcohol dehydrogenase family)